MFLIERILRASQEIQHQPGTLLSREQIWIVPGPLVVPIVQQIASKNPFNAIKAIDPSGSWLPDYHSKKRAMILAEVWSENTILLAQKE